MRRRSSVLVLLLALAGLIWLAARPQPTGPAEGMQLDGQTRRTADPPRDSFRVGTFNIHGCTGADGRRDVDRVADCLKDLDFVALNEVHGRGFGSATIRRHCWAGDWACSGSLPRPRAIGTHRFWQRPADVAADRVMATDSVAVNNGRGYRNAVLVRLRQREQTIRVLLTHIARSDDSTRRQQLRQTIDMYLALPAPAIFLGDLNSETGEPEIRRLLAAPGVIDAVGKSSVPTPRRESILSLSAACGYWMPACAIMGPPIIPWPGPK